MQNYLQGLFLSEKINKLNIAMDIKSNEDEDSHTAVLVDLERQKELMTINWDERGFRQVDIEFKDLDIEKDQSLIKGLDFYLKAKQTTYSHILFKNYKNFMNFFDIIVIGSLKKIW